MCLLLCPIQNHTLSMQSVVCSHVINRPVTTPTYLVVFVTSAVAKVTILEYVSLLLLRVIIDHHTLVADVLFTSDHQLRPLVLISFVDQASATLTLFLFSSCQSTIWVIS